MTRRALLAGLGAGLGLLCLVPARARAMIFDAEMIRCATCQYWAGTRKSHANRRVETDYAERGRCTNPESPYRNLFVNPTHACPVYLRWDQLD